MAGEDRTASSAVSLYRRLQQEPYKYGFFHALRQIECHHPDKARIGSSFKPVEDPVRFAQEPSMAFAPSTLSSFSAFEVRSSATADCPVFWPVWSEWSVAIASDGICA